VSETEKPLIVFYHGNCPDGWCSAFLIKLLWDKDAELRPCVYGTPPPSPADIEGRRVMVLDFTWPRHIVQGLNFVSKSLVILDHHKSAEQELAGLDYAHFDMTKSGAMLTYEWIQAQSAIAVGMPWYVRYVQDRDLWKFELPESRAINAWIMAQPQTYDAWGAFPGSPETVVPLGRSILQHIAHYMEKVAAQAVELPKAMNGPLHRRKVMVVNAAYPNISDVLGYLCDKGADVAMGWFVRGDGLVQFSLTSHGDVDVSEIARAFGGGGHKRAAGFELTRPAAVQLLGLNTTG